MAQNKTHSAYIPSTCLTNFAVVAACLLSKEICILHLQAVSWHVGAHINNMHAPFGHMVRCCTLLTHLINLVAGAGAYAVTLSWLPILATYLSLPTSASEGMPDLVPATLEPLWHAQQQGTSSRLQQLCQ